MKAKIIAFYLPQFHPIKENNEWWGEGFTEWTNVGRSKPLFKGHYQPRVPADLGYYDLRMPETRIKQALMAKEYGIYGFCYWHYWFGRGKKLLELPFNEVLKNKDPDFPFCLGWANESWESKIWDPQTKNPNKILIEQTYPGSKDNEIHFYSVLDAFKDSRYIKVESKPIFLIYKPLNIPDIQLFIQQWNELAKKNDLNNGLYFIAQTESFENYSLLKKYGFNSITINPISRVHNKISSTRNKISNKIYKTISKIKYGKVLNIIEYKYAIKYMLNPTEDIKEDVIPMILPNWDHSPRSKEFAFILNNSNPDLFENLMKIALEIVENKEKELQLVFLKSWNEWGEGNYIEPDLKFGKQYLEVIKKLNCKD